LAETLKGARKSQAQRPAAANVIEYAITKPAAANAIKNAKAKLDDTGVTFEAEAITETEIVIAIKKSYTQTIAAVEPLLPRYANMRIYLVGDVYPAGDEVLLIHEAIGAVIPPGTLPVESGLLVLNVETVYNIYRAVYENAPVIHKWVTVTGEVRNPATLRLLVGSTVSEAIEKAGGSCSGEPAYIIGGPMMGYLAANGFEAIKKTTNAVIVVPHDHFLVQTYSRNPRIDLNRVASACCQCRVCTDICPRRLLGYPIEPHRIMRALATRDCDDVQALGGALYCSLCGVCERVACPQGLAPRALLRMYKTALGKHGVKPLKQEAGAVDAGREYRQCGEARLTLKLGLAKYINDAPMIND
jgi:Na+-translocating ferredoxin:NAD+ oxidoreductase RnfC subunit